MDNCALDIMVNLWIYVKDDHLAGTITQTTTIKPSLLEKSFFFLKI